MTIEEFWSKYKTYFENDKGEQLVFELGEEIDDDNNRLNQALGRFTQIVNSILDNKDVWIILFCWNENLGSFEDLKKCGFNPSNANFIYKIDKENNVTNLEIDDDDGLYLLYYEKYNIGNLIPLASAVVAKDLGLEKSANVNAYFLNFSENPILINLYDDRGMELISNDLNWIKDKTKKVKDYYQK